jgi:enoyl-CoA hydratase
MTTKLLSVTGSVIKTVSVREPYSLGFEFLREFVELLTDGSWTETRAVILTGTHPEAFLVDVSKIQSLAPAAALAFSELGQRMCAAIEALPCAVIAAIDGLALGGGCELALACDVVYATDRSQFGQIEVHGGIIPGFGGTWRLLRRAGDLKGRQLLLTGATLDAQCAFDAGLITEIVASDKLQRRAVALAETIAANPPLAVRTIKQMAIANRSLSPADSNALERQAFAFLFGTQDQKNAMQAFLEKRTVGFQGS